MDHSSTPDYRCYKCDAALDIEKGRTLVQYAGGATVYRIVICPACGTRNVFELEAE